ncbi:putative flavin-containing monooxygenase 1 [Abeliophyllum distichum]|uniref:Flavin-containing monooxygenase n=1 Tax=Abeliophyllum distichum TaxID=126358 RepID=A0ABD1Q3B5_9LAMI
MHVFTENFLNSSKKSNISTMEEQRVAIVGAGISGLLACKYLVSKGFNPVVLESKDEIGGVWTQTIQSTKLQTEKEDYQFTDFPWPSSVKETFPHNTRVKEYIQSYAKHFNLFPYIKFNSKVISIDYVGESFEEMKSWEQWGGTGKPFGSKGKWHLQVQHTKDDCSTKEYVFEFLFICIGRFSGLPDIPEFPLGEGPEVFEGKVLHSMDYSALDSAGVSQLIKGKKVTVIGSAKSAIDLAAECAHTNGIDQPCTVIQRTVHWTLPNPEECGMNIEYLWLSRFAELMVHKPGQGYIHSALATALSPLRWGFSKYIESYLKRKLPLKKFNMIPKHSFLQEMSGCGIYILPLDFYGKVENKSIILKQAKSFRFCKEGLILDEETEPLKTDVVIFATGYKGDEKLKNLFTCSTFQKYMMGSHNSVVPLYRQMIHPRIPQLAILGFAEGLSDLYTFEIECQWLAHFLANTFKLPSISDMEKDILNWDVYMKKYTGKNYRRSCLGGVQIWYNDLLCKDIGCDPKRKNGFFSELFEAYQPADYVGLNPQ